VKCATSEIERVCTPETTCDGVVPGYNKMLCEWNNVGRAMSVMMERYN
jgi:hypothetical protein